MNDDIIHDKWEPADGKQISFPFSSKRHVKSARLTNRFSNVIF